MINKLVRKFKATVSNIHWPSKEEVVRDTVYVMVTTAILSLLILGWTTGIDAIIGLFV